MLSAKRIEFDSVLLLSASAEFDLDFDCFYCIVSNLNLIFHFAFQLASSSSAMADQLTWHSFMVRFATS